MIPATIYGAGKENALIAVSRSAFEKVWREAGESSLVELSGLASPETVLIHEVAKDPVYGEYIHADFLRVDANEKVSVSIPLSFVGTAPAEKDLGGILIKVLHEVEVEALPKDLPHTVEVDISSLATFEDKVLVKDIKLPAGVTLTNDDEDVVALVQEAVAEEEATTPADVSSVEVAKKGKATEEGAE
jgi:large subunit ribosomal protein L25